MSLSSSSPELYSTTGGKLSSGSSRRDEMFLERIRKLGATCIYTPFVSKHFFIFDPNNSILCLNPRFFDVIAS